jgi:hypothetical protein
MAIWCHDRVDALRYFWDAGMMADTIRSLFWCHQPFPARRAAAHAAEQARRKRRVAIDDPKIALAEARDVTAALVLGQADKLAGQCLADEHVLAAPL